MRTTIQKRRIIKGDHLKSVDKGIRKRKLMIKYATFYLHFSSSSINYPYRKRTTTRAIRTRTRIRMYHVVVCLFGMFFGGISFTKHCVKCTANVSCSLCRSHLCFIHYLQAKSKCIICYTRKFCNISHIN